MTRCPESARQEKSRELSLDFVDRPVEYCDVNVLK